MESKTMFFVKKIILAFVVLHFTVALSFSQQNELSQLERKFDSDSLYRFQEKLFIHIDQPSYLTGETMWLKIYLVDRNSNKLSPLSKVAYLELMDKNNEVVLKTKIPLANGTGDGLLFLPATLSTGNYSIVAYTRWMRNFSTEFYFHQTIKVVNPFVKLSSSFASAEKPKYDIQFFPEGGNLVAGLTSYVGFRAVGRNGKGIKFKGSLINNKNDTVAHFTPLKFGLGQFSFTPHLHEHYRAVVIDTTGHAVITPLPDAFEEGYAIRATDEGEFVKLDIRSKLKDSIAGPRHVYLFLLSKNVKKIAKVVDIINGAASYQVDKKTMSEGVNRFILFDQKLNSVCERSFFVSPKNEFNIQVQSDKASYPTRGEVKFHITPTPGNHIGAMSLAVYRIDSLALDASPDISSFLWLTSELKGTIESPGYYLEHSDDHLAIDNLMLTHGWSRFKWEDIRNNEPPQFIPDYGGQLFFGRVMNTDETPAKGINAYLSVAGKDGRVYVSQSDERGIVHFDLHDFYGERKIFLQTNPKMDSTYRVELSNSYAENHGEFLLPELELSKKLVGTISTRSLDTQLQYAFLSQSQTPVPPKTDVPFYGKPDEKYLLDDFTRFPTMEEVMREYIKGVMVRKRKDGFHFLTLDHPNIGVFEQNPLVLLDGVPIFDINKIMAFDPRKVQRLDVITRQYYLGRLTFNGLVSYFTYDGDLGDYISEKTNVSFVDGLQSRREFFSPVYETPLQLESRIPDKRHLLLWLPEVKADSQGQFTASCFTSDVSGNFRVVVQALSSEGKPSVATAGFSVDGSSK